ncbi:hypothetical protein [Enterocloster sp.]|uniref:hypothetical protein n=1 Tax=Enterocloster sp. TaxID=2719315 RepID=UPI0039A140A9
MNSNKRINLLVDLVKLALIILIACVLVSVIVFIVTMTRGQPSAVFSWGHLPPAGWATS